MTTTNQDPFPLFRAAYLRTVALYWANPNDPWIKEVIAEKDDAMPMLKRRFNFPFDWKTKLRVNENGPAWQPGQGTNPWVVEGGQARDAFTIRIPYVECIPPEALEGGIDESHVRAEIVAAYYQQRPNLLGAVNSAETLSTFNTPPEFSNIGAVFMSVLGQVFEDAEFRARLIEESKPGSEGVAHLLQDRFDFMFPFNFRLYFEERKASWKKVTTDGLYGEDTTNFELVWDEDDNDNIIELALPQRPPNDTRVTGALAAYNQTGPQYPFTCG